MVIRVEAMGTLSVIAIAYACGCMALGLLVICAAAMGGRADRELELEGPVPRLRLARSEAQGGSVAASDARVTGVCPSCLLIVEEAAPRERCPVCDVRLANPPRVATPSFAAPLQAVEG
jgi:hypothetical protein